VLYLSQSDAVRLVVFVHGFRGSALETWQRFPESGRSSAWWRASDMLFVGYDSVRDNITGAAARLRRELPRFYPRVPSDLVQIGDAAVRETIDQDYEELLVVGHSLGGVVVRRALCDVAQGWLDRLEDDPGEPRPALLDARLRLFSPASAGFRPGGWLALVRGTKVWGPLEMFLRRSSAYSDLQPESPLLADTRRRTEALVAARRAELEALRASIVWANPDDVVLAERYDSDRVDDTIDGTSHGAVCKPRAEFTAPRTFVESAQL
jgi:pimeloyl-ACP methyl ester carboxylesterase